MTTDTIDGMEAGATTWKESISELSSLLKNNSNNNNSSSDTVKIEKNASAILLTNNNTNNNDGIPASIAATVTSIYLRALRRSRMSSLQTLSIIIFLNRVLSVQKSIDLEGIIANATNDMTESIGIHTKIRRHGRDIK